MFRIVIPARFASARLPGKPLLPIAGRPMIEWVYRQAVQAGAAEVLIASDDARILEAARAFGAAAVPTSAAHASGSDRIAEVARLRGWSDADIVVNLQGDEPLMPPALVRQVAQLLSAEPNAQMATLASPIGSLEELLNPNIVKVVADLRGRALYFSRAPVPWNRDGAPEGWGSQSRWSEARRHIGLYAYRAGALQRLAALAPSALESCEKLEQLRALEHGFVICVADACARPGPDVNTSEDLARLEAMLAGGRC